MRLVITLLIQENEVEELTLNEVRELLMGLYNSAGDITNAEVALLREGDRSGANLLLPKLQGRMGNHYQSRKAKIIEVIDV